jgi:hypothetical protein
MIKLLKFAAISATTFVLVVWVIFIAARHKDGDIILTSSFGWQAPHVRKVLFFLPRGESIQQAVADGYWFGGDVIHKDIPRWVLVLPCPKWMGTVGGSWYGSSDGYSKWFPSL